MSTQPTHILRLVGSAGSNKVMAGELSRLAMRAFGRRPPLPSRQGIGALRYPFDAKLAALAVRYHRTSARVLWDLFESRAERLEPLYAGLRAAIADDDRRWLFAGARISVLAFGVEAFAAGERQVVGAVKNALLDGARARGITLSVDGERPQISFHVRMPVAGSVLLSIDLAGRPMHQRGYRLASGAAPLREDLAAQLVMLSRHDPRSEALVDPMAGSGTIGIEAACLGRGRPVWQSGRQPLARFLPELVELLQGRAPPLFADTKPDLFLAEADPQAFEALERNLETAGVHAERSLTDFRSWEPDHIKARIREHGGSGERGVIVSNPPYGERIGRDLDRVYRDLGRWCRAFSGWRAGILIANPRFLGSFGGQPRIKKPLKNGPLDAYFLLYDL